MLQVATGTNLLETLRANDVPISYSCMAGHCGTCRCKVIRGSAIETGREAKITNATEGDYVLACASVLNESCAIEIPETDEIVTQMARIIKATVTAIEDATHDIRIIGMQPAKPLAFSPGQYAALQLTPDHIRSYSMASLCNDDALESHIRRVPDGRVTAHVFEQLKLGDVIRVSGLLGTAYLRRRHAQSALRLVMNSVSARHIQPNGHNSFDFIWTHFGFEDDTPEMTGRRLIQANLFGPAGFVSADDGEVIELSQFGFEQKPSHRTLAELGGYACENADRIVTETLIRGMYHYWRKAMEL